MFQQLATMLRKGDSLTVTIAQENDTQLRVNVFPKLFTLDGQQGENRQALNTPLSIVDTPDKLDGPEFIETLQKFGASVNVLRHTLDEVEAAHKTAGDKAKAKATAPKAESKKQKAENAAAKPAARKQEEDSVTTETLI